MKRLTSLQDAKQHTFLSALFTFFSNKHEVCNEQGFSDLNHLSSVQQKYSKSQIHVHFYLQLKLFEK